MSMDYNKNLRTLQVELSTICNALCLGCVRTDTTNYNRQRITIPKAKYIDIQIIRDIAVSIAGKNLRRIEFCGNIDEPLVHPDLVPLLRGLFEDRPDLQISIHTNGGISDEKKYLEISQILSRFAPGSNMRFSIDGLEDTNHIYRQHVRWGKLFNNLKAAISGGAPVIWQYLVFPWNQHQVEEAATLAKDLGCSDFWIRPDRSLASATGLERINEFKKRDLVKQANPGKLSNLKKYVSLKGKPIECSFRNEGMLFLSWEGKVWPCCFISNIFYESELKKRIFKKFVLDKYPENFNNLYMHSFDEVLEAPLFKSELVKSWENGGANDKMAFRCVERCSVALIRSSDKKPDDRSHYERRSLR
jgi:MoaA/NifB/PqqE/SkfB family radical SAM enzyme